MKLASYDYDFLQCVYEDGDLLWFGTANGLFNFNKYSKKIITYYSYQNGNKESLSNNFIYSLCNDAREPSKYLWIGTKGGGLNRLDKITGHVRRYSTKQGLINNTIYGILTDKEGNLWMSTNKGISEFNIKSNKFRNFDISDGLQGNEFNRYAYCKTVDGLLVFGGLNGINYFDPAEIKYLDPPRVVLTELRLFNKKVSLREPGSILKKDISFTKQLVLQYHQNVVTLVFSGVDYRKKGRLRYRYKMEGFDQQWIYSGATHEATYTNLDPGDYRFVVQASFEDARWGDQQTSIAITVISPWWRTWWFYSLVVATFLLSTYALYRYRLHQVTRFDNLRNRIARDLHDEVGSSLSTIAIYSRLVHQHLGSSSFNNEPLMKKITENVTEIMDSMSDIVWSINTKNDTFESIINRMREHAYELFEAKEYTFHFDFSENIYQVKMTMESRRDFYLIYKEALNNIVKYSQGKNVWVTLFVENTKVKLIIKDDGLGFNVSQTKKSGNGLQNMHYRAIALKGELNIISAPHAGTELHLSF